MPVRIEGNVLTVAISNPFDMWPIDDLETNLGYRVETALAVSTDINDAVKKYYGVGADTIERILAETPQEENAAEVVTKQEKVEDLESDGAQDASVVGIGLSGSSGRSRTTGGRNAMGRARLAG